MTAAVSDNLLSFLGELAGALGVSFGMVAIVSGLLWYLYQAEAGMKSATAPTRRGAAGAEAEPLPPDAAELVVAIAEHTTPADPGLTDSDPSTENR